jgi:hypothetical protein
MDFNLTKFQVHSMLFNLLLRALGVLCASVVKSTLP